MAESEKIPTGIEGLDRLLKGGLLPGASIMVEGTPGTGKSTLAMQFIAEGVRIGAPGIIVTLEEYPSEFYRDALNYGWDFEAWEKEDKVRIIATSPQALKQQLETGGPLASEIKKIQAKRIAVDSINQFERMSTDPATLRTTLGGLIHAFKMEGLLSLFTKDLESSSILEYWGRYTVDVLIELSVILMKDRERHRLIEVHKARGQNHVLGRHSFKITNKGLKVYPRPLQEAVRMEEMEIPAPKRLSSGVKNLDALLGGGYISGHTILLAGGAGTGKSLTAASFAKAGADEGQKTLFITMEDPPGRILANAASIGLDLTEAVRSGLIEIVHLPPVELSPDQLIDEIETRLVTGQYQRLVVDSISSLASVTPEPDYLHDVIYAIANSCCFRRDVTGLLTAEIEELTGSFSFTDFGGSFIADSVILLRLVEVSGELKKSISIIKMRGSKHDHGLRELIITTKGLIVGKPFENLSGVLTGVPTATRPVGFEAYFGEVSPDERKVADVLAKRKEASAEEVAEAIGMDVGHAVDLLKKLAAEGYATTTEVNGVIRYRSTLIRAR